MFRHRSSEKDLKPLKNTSCFFAKVRLGFLGQEPIGFPKRLKQQKVAPLPFFEVRRKAGSGYVYIASPAASLHFPRFAAGRSAALRRSLLPLQLCVKSAPMQGLRLANSSTKPKGRVLAMVLLKRKLFFLKLALFFSPKSSKIHKQVFFFESFWMVFGCRR